MPALVRVGLSGLLQGAIEDELGNSLTVSFIEVAYHGDDRYSITLPVEGTMAVDIGPFEAVDVSVPLIVSVDQDEEQVLEWMADIPQAAVALR